MMRRYGPAILIAGLLACLAVGCSRQVNPYRSHTPPATALAGAESARQGVNSPYLVLPAPTVVQSLADRGELSPGAIQPWWQQRNDQRLGVQPGGEGPEVIDSVVYVRDRQYHSNGRVFETHHRRFYSRRTGSIYR